MSDEVFARVLAQGRSAARVVGARRRARGAARLRDGRALEGVRAPADEARVDCDRRAPTRARWTTRSRGSSSSPTRFLSVGTPVQRALPTLLASSNVPLVAIRARARANLARLRAALASASSPATAPRRRRGLVCDVALASDARPKKTGRWPCSKRDGVYVHPGHFFDFPDEAYVVVSLLTDEATFAAGIARVLARVADGTSAPEARRGLHEREAR